ncbi:hypothetical protein HanXRQr2_Chr17g0808391 [Helianthus annuus]|uniref:Uncharacterized protein n=1 Tax=Helianthus annuus TaxID=4232 RepID=A0A9K3DJS8_HELAN|nr:hypothetical protein HanXRQr2_Chr17g0808391 [Helianthus annuus]KAJ0813642.1 hypothetical protein HanPSC8_Chr17g0775881 [Helianthus annuus]
MMTMMLKMKVEVADGGIGRRSHVSDVVIGGVYVQVEVVPVIGLWVEVVVVLGVARRC